MADPLAGQIGTVMAYFGAKRLICVGALCLGATGTGLGATAAHAQAWSWFFRGPAAMPAASGPTAPAARPVRVIKAGKSRSARQVLRETTAQDVRRTRDITREFSALADRVSVEAALQLDPTLRRGDIAVTSTGLHVFKGRQARFHPQRDFLPLARSSLAMRRELKAIQTAGRYERPSATTRTAFIDVLTIRPLRKIAEARSRESPRRGFHVIDVPRMR
jgi:hypothetical protein